MASFSIPAKDTEGEITVVPNWLQLPTDITTNILERLGTVEIVTNACQVCPVWRNICKDPFIWRTIDMSNITFVQHCYTDFAKICRIAVELSRGYVKNIDIEIFGTDDLLESIAKNAGDLRCMRLAYCLRISDIGFIEAVRKLPLLEDVNISHCNLSKDSLEVLGRSCPLLKSLKFEKTRNEHNGSRDDEAFAIAETMFGLCHLFIEGNELTNEGLLAILDGCPLLESLDIQGCYNLSLSGSLMKRCVEQIKDLKLPILKTYENYSYDVHVPYWNFVLEDFIFPYPDALSEDDYLDDFYE